MKRNEADIDTVAWKYLQDLVVQEKKSIGKSVSKVPQIPAPSQDMLLLENKNGRLLGEQHCHCFHDLPAKKIVHCSVREGD